MYVKRTHPLSPPANYAGVAFSKERTNAAGVTDTTKIHKAQEQKSKNPALLPAREVDAVIDEPQEDIATSEPKDEIAPTPEAASDGLQDSENSNKEGGILSKLSEGKFSLEDILLFASLFLLASGQTEDELLLLAGVILLLCNS